MSLRERVADLTKVVGDALAGQASVTVDERLQIRPVEELHDVIERAFIGHAEVVDVDGVR